MYAFIGMIGTSWSCVTMIPIELEILAEFRSLSNWQNFDIGLQDDLTVYIGCASKCIVFTVRSPLNTHNF